MLKKPGRPFGGIGAGVEGAVVGEHVHAQRRDLAVLRRGDLGRHVIVAGEGGRGQILDPVLHPFHRPTGDDRGDDRADIARIDADLVAEAAADVGRDDVDLVLGDAGISDAATVRTTCGAWNVPHTVSSPSTLSNEATHWQVSSGQGCTR